jgi:thiol:disulfide interchange protein
MAMSLFGFLESLGACQKNQWRRLWAMVLSVVVIILGVTVVQVSPAIAILTDDRFDGDIFTLYAGNGSLVPPKVTLAQAFQRQKPILLAFYIDDSSDCKQYAPVLSQLQGFYGRVSDFVILRVDAVPQKAAYTPTDAGYYYKDAVPQTVLFDATGKMVFNEVGSLPFERIDDEFRKVFALLPRSESIALKRRAVNEINTELVK